MDKREPGKTITIKINGKQQSFEETRQKSDRKQDPFINDRKDRVTTEKEPMEQRFEKTKPVKLPLKGREDSTTISEAAVAHDTSEESFDWILPDSTPNIPKIKEYKMTAEANKSQKKSPKKWPTGKRKISKRMFTTIFTAVFLAVLLGTSFGFIMLKLVFIEKPIQTSIVQKPSTTPEPEHKQAEQQSGKLSLVLPTITTWVVQEGVYSNKNSATQIVNSLKEKGASAAIFESNGQSFLLLSVADTKDHAKEYGERLKESGVPEFITKEMSFSGHELRGLQVQEKEYIEGIPLLFETMTTAASIASVTDSLPKALLDSINQQSEKLAQKKDTLSNEKIKDLKVQVDAAVQNINSMEKSVGKQKLTSLQQQLLSILIAYQAL